MNKHDLTKLQAIQEFPSISIIAPTHPAFPEALKNHILLKDLIKQAIKELETKAQASITAPLIDKLHKLEQYIDFSKSSKSLALFVNKDIATVFYLPWTLPEHISVDETFALRELIAMHAKFPAYWVLALSRGSTRLLHYSDDYIYEIIEPTLDSEGKPVSGFPLNDLGPSEHKYLAIGTGDLDSRYKDDREIQFFRFVDTHLAKFLKQEDIPVLLLGVAEDITYFKEATHHKSSIIETINGNFDHANFDHIKDALHPAIERIYAAKAQDALKKLDEAVGALKYASDIEPVWHMAQQGRVHVLLIEDNLKAVGIVNPENPDQVSLNAPEQALKKGEDIIQHLIEIVNAKGGEILFLKPGTLKEHNKIAAILRY